MASGDRRLERVVERACKLRDAGSYRDARKLFQAALAAAEKAFGMRSVETARVLNHYGMLLKYSGRPDEAASLYRRALAIVGSARCELTANLLHNLGGAEYARGKFAKGESYAKRAIRVRLFVEGGYGIGAARDTMALAALIAAQGRGDEAERIYRSVLPVLELHHDGIHSAVVLNNIAVLCQAGGRFAEAEKLYRRAVRLRKDLLGDRHPDLATTLNNFATLYRLMGRRVRAAALYRRALAIFEKTLNRAHPNVIGCRGNLARLEAEV